MYGLTSTENAGRLTSQIKNVFRQTGCSPLPLPHPPEIIADLVSVKCRQPATHKTFLFFMVTVRFGVYVDLHASSGLRSRGRFYHRHYYISNSCTPYLSIFNLSFGRYVSKQIFTPESGTRKWMRQTQIILVQKFQGNRPLSRTLL